MNNMSKKVLILSGSPRKGGNSDLLCDEFARGAEKAGHLVEKIHVQDLKISGCLACYGCRETRVCVQKDDMAQVLEKMIAADVIVLATPVYFYSLDGQMKTMIDRTLPRYTEIRDKDFYFIATAAAGARAIQRTMDALCFGRALLLSAKWVILLLERRKTDVYVREVENLRQKNTDRTSGRWIVSEQRMECDFF